MDYMPLSFLSMLRPEDTLVELVVCFASPVASCQFSWFEVHASGFLTARCGRGETASGGGSSVDCTPGQGDCRAAKKHDLIESRAGSLMVVLQLKYAA